MRQGSAHSAAAAGCPAAAVYYCAGSSCERLGHPAMMAMMATCSRTCMRTAAVVLAIMIKDASLDTHHHVTN
jgi:hypothetical protein